MKSAGLRGSLTAQRVNPLLRDLLAPMQYYWVTAQAEYSTDVLFRSHQALEEFMPRLLTYSTLYFEALTRIQVTSEISRESGASGSV